MADDQALFNLQGVADAWSQGLDWIDTKKGRAADAQRDSQFKFSTDHVSGMSTLTAPTSVTQRVLGAASNFGEIQKLYEQRIADIEAKREQIKQHPWQNALSQLAASLASQDKNPITRAIGVAAERLNPTLGELDAREALLMRDLQTSIGMESSIDFKIMQAGHAAEMGAAQISLAQARAGELAAKGEAEKVRATAYAEHTKKMDVYRGIEAEAKKTIAEAQKKRAETQASIAKTQKIPKGTNPHTQIQKLESAKARLEQNIEGNVMGMQFATSDDQRIQIQQINQSHQREIQTIEQELEFWRQASASYDITTGTYPKKETGEAKKGKYTGAFD